MKGLFQCPPWARSFCPFRAYGVSKSTSPLGVPADLQSAVKKGSTYKNRGICNPPTKGKACSFAADYKSAETK